MKEYISIIGILLITILALAEIGMAEDNKSSLSPEDIKKYLGLSIYLQSDYSYNFNNPDSQENEFRLFDHKANSFTLDIAELLLNKDALRGGIGYRLKLIAGETAKFIHSRGLGQSDNPFDLTEAYIDYLAPIHKGLKFRFGKFATYHGAEVLEAKDNPNYSRSFLFNYAIPVSHTGLMVGYNFTDALSVNLHFVNGWDNTSDNNKGKTFGLSINYAPIKQIPMTFNFMYGPEQDHNSTNKRFLFDWIATMKFEKSISIILNADYATEEGAAPDSSTAKWYGISGIAKKDFANLFSLAVRAEYFNDRDGVRTGISQSLKEITITAERTIANAAIVQIEYRHDWSDKNVFDSGNKDHQDTFSLSLMYSW